MEKGAGEHDSNFYGFARVSSKFAKAGSKREYGQQIYAGCEVAGQAGRGDCIDSLEQLLHFKQALQQRGYAARSINSMLSAVNKFVCYCGHPEWKLRFLKVQRVSFADEQREISRSEYQRLVDAAGRRGNHQLALIMQTICATGIRVSELRAITVAGLKKGVVEICSKAKIRTILLPKGLCAVLADYCHRHGIISGCIFVSGKGVPLDRGYIWRTMKRLCKWAKGPESKVFPHNLRHLFARCFYQKHKDIVRLADILGHSSMDTTRIYTIKNSRTERQRLDALGLVRGGMGT